MNKEKTNKILILNILLLFISIMISVTLLNKEDPRIYILIYWIINMIKTAILTKRLKKKTLLLASASAFFAAVLLLFSHTPWPMIFSYWVFIHLTHLENVPMKDRLFMYILFILAITVNLIEVFNIDPWFMITTYWIITALRCPNLLKWQR